MRRGCSAGCRTTAGRRPSVMARTCSGPWRATWVGRRDRVTSPLDPRVPATRVTLLGWRARAPPRRSERRRSLQPACVRVVDRLAGSGSSPGGGPQATALADRADAGERGGSWCESGVGVERRCARRSGQDLDGSSRRSTGSPRSCSATPSTRSASASRATWTPASVVRADAVDAACRPTSSQVSPSRFSGGCAGVAASPLDGRAGVPSPSAPPARVATPEGFLVDHARLPHCLGTHRRGLVELTGSVGRRNTPRRSGGVSSLAYPRSRHLVVPGVASANNGWIGTIRLPQR